MYTKTSRDNAARKGFLARLKTTAAIVLTAVLLALIPVSAFASDGSCGCGYDPFTIIHGTSLEQMKTNPDGTRTALFEDGDYVSQIIDTALPDAFLGLTTGYWDPYCKKVLDIILPAFEGFAPSTDGVIPEGSDIGWSWNYDTIRSAHGYDMGTANHYFLDARKSTRSVAEDLNEFIETSKSKTGHDKVELIGRCESNAALLDYLYEYARPDNYAGLDSVVFSDLGFMGINYVQDLFAGTVKIDGDCAYRFFVSGDFSGIIDASMTDAIRQIIDELQKVYGIEITAAMANRVYRQLKDKLIAPILRAYYAREPGLWTFVNEKFDTAVEYLFPTNELKAEFAPIIAEARWFHENVQKNAATIITEMRDAGVRVAVDLEYGFPQYPLSEDAAEVGDKLTGAKYKSIGATVSDIDTTLSDEYIASREAAGYGAYISPDRQIDASTCLLPDTTWFIKNINHEWPAQLDAHYLGFCRHQFDDVFSDPDHPQYLLYDPAKPVFVPLTAENDITPKFQTPKNLLQKIVQFFRDLFERIRKVFTGLF